MERITERNWRNNQRNGIMKGFAMISIGGKKRPIKFGTNQTVILCELRDCTIADIQQMMSIEKIQAQQITGGEIVDLLYSALLAGARTKDSAEDFTRHAVGDWIDEMDQDELTRVFSVMAASQPVAKKKATRAKQAAN